MPFPDEIIDKLFESLDPEHPAKETLVKIFSDLRSAYRQVDEQLSGAIRLNRELVALRDELQAQTASLRGQIDQAKEVERSAQERCVELEREIAAMKGARRERTQKIPSGYDLSNHRTRSPSR